MNQAGLQAVDVTAKQISELVDELLEKHWNRRSGEFIETEIMTEPVEAIQATCSCGSGIPIQEIEVEGKMVAVMALPLIFAKMKSDGKTACEENARELLETVRIYNPIPPGAEDVYSAALLREYKLFCERQELSL